MRKPGGCQLFPLLEQFAQLELDPLLRALSHRSLISKTPCSNGCISKLTVSFHTFKFCMDGGTDVKTFLFVGDAESAR